MQCGGVGMEVSELAIRFLTFLNGARIQLHIISIEKIQPSLGSGTSLRSVKSLQRGLYSFFPTISWTVAFRYCA